MITKALYIYSPAVDRLHRITATLSRHGESARLTDVEGGGLIAGLNLYSSTIGAFDDDTVEAAMLFAIQAAHTLGRVITQKQLTDAMTTSTTIGRATGVVMQRFQLSADRAFELLTRVSRIKDLTLEVLADQILDEVTNTPTMSAPIASISVPSAVG